MIWKPHATVAAIIQRDGLFLMVKEECEGQVVYNQPAGHLDPDESLIDAAIRETREETAWRFHPQALVGFYRWVQNEKQRTYLRAAFCGHCDDHDPSQSLDEGILEAVWLSRDELGGMQDQLRSPLVLRCIDDFLDGQRYPLELFTDL
jgi:8-oxo-dGTP pyrophosphatase MutT (NUDIX family)